MEDDNIMSKTFYSLMIILCLFSSVLTSVAPQQISFNPEYVSPPPAEISYLSLDAVDRGAYTDFRMSMVAYSLEGGPFIAGLFALYSSWEACWSQWVNGPGRIDFSVSCSWRKGYQSIGHPLFISRSGNTLWVQSIDINGLDRVCQTTAQPSLIDVTVETHKDLGGILIHVLLNAPGSNNVVRLRLYRNGQLIYDFAKTVNMPTVWVGSPCIDLRIDFGPLRFKKSGPYIIEMDVNSDGKSFSKSLNYEEPSRKEEQISLCVYHHLLLIYPETSIEYVEEGFLKRFHGSMSDRLVLTIISAFKNFAENLVRDGSGGLVTSTYNIIIAEHPMTTISNYNDGYYWLSPDDVMTDLAKYASEGRYDSVFVIWYNGPVKTFWGLGGVFINDGGTIFSSIASGEESWWTGPESSGQVFLHEWLHGVARFFQELGYIMPEGDADGAENYGYVWTPEEGWMAYYRDLMQGKVWDSKLSRFVGIPSEAWSRYCSPNIVKLKKTSELYQQLYQLQEEYTRLKTSYSDLRDNYDSLSREYGALQKNYSLLEDSFTKLERKYKEIEGSYINLLRNYEVLSDKYSSLEESYSSLEKDYLALKLEQEKLKSKYQEIKSLYDQMKVEYEKIQDELTLTRSRLHTYLVGFIIIAILAASLIIITIIRARQRKLLIN